MYSSINHQLHLRELSSPAARSRFYRKLYGHRGLISDLDIVNELDGHSGCVNALSWSKSGRLLASGSDDQHLNIYSYQPSDSCDQFQFALTVATGHVQNIFSVKFMPHSNDHTVITAAGDSEVRIFDLEYAGRATETSSASSIASQSRRRVRSNLYENIKYLTDGDTNCRVYRSHGDRVKRIVTESSPHLFMTCSEDGEVRQWDLRQPSSAYPPPRGKRFASDGSIPPPLISYKRYGLDLNSISCSASQPHYIALGGAHLHAFLHDRRMTGRDRLQEAGRLLAPISQLSAEEQQVLAQATQCVRKFAPRGQKVMRKSDTGHITALKISDARPDEMVVSWSGDHIYAFDLIRDPKSDADETVKPLRNSKTQGAQNRKRKRQVTGSQTSLSATARPSSRPPADAPQQSGQSALRIRYQNGQSEDIPISDRDIRRRPLTNAEREAQRIARAYARIRSSLFGRTQNDDHALTFTATLGHAASILSDIDEAVRDWRYPMDPSPVQLYAQRKQRESRESTRRFVQAAGTLARVLGGRLQTPSGISPLMIHFSSIERRSNDLEMHQHERFGYDFLKAILLWLDSGLGSLIDGFTRPDGTRPESKAGSCLPIPASEASVESIDEFLVPYLLRLASDRPIVDLATNRFEVDANREMFSSESLAVSAFAAAVKIPFEDLSAAAFVRCDDSSSVQSQDRQAARRYWALRVGRGVLFNATEDLKSRTVNHAFGGTDMPSETSAAEEVPPRSVIADEAEDSVRGVEVIDPNGDVIERADADDISAAAQEIRNPTVAADAIVEAEHNVQLVDEPGEWSGLARRARGAAMEDNGDENSNNQDNSSDRMIDDDDGNDDDEDNDDDKYDDRAPRSSSTTDDNDNDDDEYDDDEGSGNASSEIDEEDGVPSLGSGQYLYQSVIDRSALRPKVEPNTPAVGPTRSYHGHCNVKTVKDVNFFGPDDEYVVSGSDDGNFFIWDRKTSELVNILEGDGEVVNVIQGHPYEPMLAVSGIDHTIKIFSPDARAREVARLGRGVSAHDASSFSSLAWPARIGRLASRRSQASQEQGSGATSTSEPAGNGTSAGDSNENEDSDSYVAPSGLRSRKRMHDSARITQNNDVEREGGNHEAMITRALLAQLAQRVSQHRTQTGTTPTRAAMFNAINMDELDDDCVMQ